MKARKSKGSGGALDKPGRTPQKRKAEESKPSRLIWLTGVFAVVLLGIGVFWFVSGDTSEHASEGNTIWTKPKVVGGMKLGDPLQIPQNSRQKAVVNAFKHAWKAYRKYAWGKDELKPISKSSSQWFNLGLTLIDSLDTMWLMGLTDQFNVARSWVAKEMIIEQDIDVNLFETTIRVLGGLLSTYHLNGENVFLNRAIELGDKLMASFSSKSGIPFSDVNLFTGQVHAPEWGPDSSVSEVSTIQLEFRDLSMLTGNKKYKVAVDKVTKKLQSLPKKDNLVPLFINAETGQLRPGTLTMGARADTYYEYLLKQWVQSGRTEKRFRDWFLLSMKGVENHLLRYSKPSHLLFIGEETVNGEFYAKMDHLVCYLPGTLMLGVQNGLSRKFTAIAEKLMHTCFQMYAFTPTGLSPEIVHFNLSETSTADMYIKPLDRHNLLRPETVESLFYLYRYTGNSTYQDWGWKIFQAFEKYTKVDNGGFSSINNVMDRDNVGFRDKMESFFLGETLKYLFLLFSDQSDVINLEHWVFNTEAHPLPIWPNYYYNHE